MCTDIVIQDIGNNNPLAHIMLTLHHSPKKTLGGKQKKSKFSTHRATKSMTQKSGNTNANPFRRPIGMSRPAKEWLQGWADLCNAALEKYDHAERIDHHSYEWQGINQIPTVHLGVRLPQRRSEALPPSTAT